MIKKWLATLICCCLLAASVPITAGAAQTGATLTAGRVYTFSNADERTVSYVSFSGTARYEYVTRDAAGEVADFGVSAGRFGVRGGGTTTVSLLNASSASVTYNNAKITVKDAGGSALARVTANPDESICLTNTGDQAARIAVDNTGLTEYARYDIAIRDNSGAVTFFADASRYTTLSLPPGGSATLTPQESELRLMYPAAYGDDITHAPSDTPALILFAMEADKTYTVANTSPVIDAEVGVSGGVALTYDYIRKNQWGYTVDYRPAAETDRIAADAGDVLYITPKTAVTLVYPAAWQTFLSVAEGGNGRLLSYSVAVGETLTLENTDPFTAFTFRADPAEPASLLDYTYSGGVYGDAEYAMGETFTEKTLSAGYSWSFTVKKGASLNLWLPAVWLSEGLRVNGTAASALTDYALMPGTTLRLINGDTLNEYTITLVSEYPGREAVYDYVVTGYNALTGSSDTQYGIECNQSVQTLPAGGTMFITAGKSEALTVWLPTATAVTAQISTEPAVAKYNLSPGASVAVNNTSELYAFPLTVQYAGSAVGVAGATGATGVSVTPLDYVLKDADGQISDFGSLAPATAITVDAGGNALLTNSDVRSMVVAYPQSWRSQGVALTKTTAKALYRQTLGDQGAIDIKNSDKRYARSFIVESAVGAILPVQYEYVQRTDRSVVLDYGVGGTGRMSVYGGGRTTIMAQKGVTMRISYPAEWQEKSVKLSAAANAPLYHKTLKPGGRQNLNNRTKNDYSIMVEAGSYYIRYDNDNSRVTASERPSSGPVNVPAGTSVLLIAATGADLELVMPWEWAAQLGA